MVKQVMCPIDKIKELILESYPDYYEFDKYKQKFVIEEFVKSVDVDMVFNYMSIKEITKDEALEIIENRKPLGLFYSLDGGLYSGIDNTTGEAGVANFKKLEDCLDWLCDKEQGE